MNKLSLDAVARAHLKIAGTEASGSSAVTVYGGHERVQWKPRPDRQKHWKQIERPEQQVPVQPTKQ